MIEKIALKRDKLGIALAIMFAFMLLGMTKVYATENTPTYTITIPSTLTVEDSGWNELNGGIKATGRNFTETQALSVTASSEHSWTLVSNNNTDTVGYNLASNNTSTYSSTATPATWEFSKSELEVADGTTKTLGVVVEDYSNKKSGIYEDTVTFTASVVVKVTGITIDNAPTEALFVNSTGTLTATVLPNNATDKTVTWSSSDPDYVSINAETGEYEVKGTKGYGSATITATAGDKTSTCIITGKVHHTSLQAGDIIRVGETIYTGDTWRVNITPGTSFTASNGVITLVEATSGSTKYYKFSRGSNGTMPNWTSFKVKDNTDGLYIVSGTGTNEDKFVFAVHTRPITFTVKRVAEKGYDYTDGTYSVADGTTWQQFINSGNAPACLSIYNGYVWHDMDCNVMDCGGTFVANVADKKRVKTSDAIIDGATYGCSDYLNYQDHD